MQNVVMSSQYYKMSKARRLQPEVLEPQHVNTHKDRQGKHIYLEKRQVSEIMLNLLIMQIRSHVNSLECDTYRIKRVENLDFFIVRFLKRKVLLPARRHEWPR
jgi:hypothetical protein